MLELLRNLAPHGSHLRQPRHNDLGKSDAPAAPDYASAATATATGNLEAARLAARANRVDQNTPYGTSTYTDLGNDRWQQNVSLAPEQQQLLDRQNQISLGLGDSMNKGLGYVDKMIASPLDTSQFTKLDPATVGGSEAVTNAILARLQPSMDQNRTQKENALLIQGHNRGGEAWNSQENDLARAENDQKLAAVQAGGAEQSRLATLQSAQRAQQLAETSTVRNEPLNTLNAVRTGAQVTNPTFTGVPQQATTQGPNLLSAAQSQYGAEMGAYNADQQAGTNMMSGLFSLGGAAMGSPWLGTAMGYGAKAAR